MTEGALAVTMLVASVGCLATAGRRAGSDRRLIRLALRLLLADSAVWSLVQGPLRVVTTGSSAEVTQLVERAGVAAGYGTAAAAWFLARALTDPAWRPPMRRAWSAWAGPQLLVLLPLPWTALELDGGRSISWDRLVLTLLALATLVRLAGARSRCPRSARRPLATMVLTSYLTTLTSLATVPDPDLLQGLDYAPVAWAISALVCADVLARNRLSSLSAPSPGHVQDSMSDAVVVLDPQGRVVSMNGAARRLTVVGGEGRPGAVLGRPAHEVLTPGLWREGDPPDRPSVFVEAAGLHLEARTNPIHDGAGDLVGAVISCREVTTLVAQQAKAETAYRIVEEERSRFQTLTSVLEAELSSTEQARTALAEVAARDPLTGLYNRRHLQTRLEAAVLRARDTSGRLAVFLIDLDHFKSVNDTYGHDVGDRVLKTVADALTDSRREDETMIRYGGEEFVVVVPGPTFLEAVRRAEEIRGRLAGLSIPLRGDLAPLAVTVSIGISTFPGHGQSATELLTAADVALYAAKSAGRNCVVTA